MSHIKKKKKPIIHLIYSFFGINTYDLNHLKVDLGIICNMLEALCGHGKFVLVPKKKMISIFYWLNCRYIQVN